MLLFILKRLMNAVFLLLLIALIGHWMIQNIPGSYDEMNREEENSAPENYTSQKIKMPLFYFGFIPERNPEELKSMNFLIPEFKWNGTVNLYHHWLVNSSASLRDGLPVGQKIWKAIQWTMALQIPAVILIFFFGIVVGIFWWCVPNIIVSKDHGHWSHGLACFFRFLVWKFVADIFCKP
ncbi:MAG: hypothetical protein IPO72_09365 [Saprospiraceae bacterium]|nr:hypothetical protein [Candidatus Vicinibacter affinis]